MSEFISDDYEDFVDLLMNFYEQQNLLASKLDINEHGEFVIGCDIQIPSLSYLADFPFIHAQTGEEAFVEDLESLCDALDQKSISEQDNNWLLPRRFVCALQITQLETLADSLEFVFPDFDSFPDLAKAALLDYYQHYGLKEGFYVNEKFSKAVDAQNWQEAASSCRRDGVDDSRNSFVVQCFEQCLTDKPNQLAEEHNEERFEEAEVEDTSDELEADYSSEQLDVDTGLEGYVEEDSQSDQESKQSDWEHRLVEELKHSEGTVAHMYCDTVGLVTVGVGCMLPDADAASKLPFVFRDTGEEAQTEEIIEAYNTVKENFTDNASANYYKSKTELILSDNAIEIELLNKIDGFVTRLKKHFPEFDQYPDDVKLGLVDMAYNLGVTGIIKKFPTFTKGVRNQDWQLCAEQCRRKQVSQERNDFVKSLFRSAA